jgi:hypothetical protein
MLYLPISRAWIVSLAARRVYFVCALLTLALFATLVGVRVAMSVAGARALTPAAASLVRVLLFPEITGAAVLVVSMWYFWFGFDHSHYLKRAIWFLLLLFVFGSVLYYFVVYCRGVSDQAQPPPAVIPREP